VLGSILTAVLTPFRGDDLDEGAFRSLLQHLVDTGSDGIAVAGTTGEASTLTDPERLRLIEVAVDEVGDRASILAGTGSNDTAHSVHMSREAARLGADAVLIVTPYYNRPPRAGIVGHFRAVATAGLPIVAYNIPGRTGINMPPDLLAELAEIPEVVAVKQANDDLTELQAIVDAGSLEVYAGNDDLLGPVLAMGGRGVISVAAHLVGQQMQAMVAAAADGDLAEVKRIDATLSPLYDALFTTTNPILIKAACEMLGLIPDATPRLPLVSATAAERANLQTVLAQTGLLGIQQGATPSV
jgi:4-hydroxy-tetrahydrodipicolinate synthase